jgi:two-component system, sensor histidine kinase and response regulator
MRVLPSPAPCLQVGPRAGVHDVTDTSSPPAVPGPIILVVDDNAINQKVAVGLLKRLGYQAEVADSGARALQALEHRPYALVLMDCQMPGMDGLEVTRLLRSREPAGTRVPVVAVTGRTEAEDRRRSLEAGMDDYITKPIMIDELRAVLARWL